MGTDTNSLMEIVERFVHGSLLYRKVDETQDAKLIQAFDAYLEFRQEVEKLNLTTNDALTKFTNLLNNYRDVSIRIFESRRNYGQEGLRSSILEETFQHLFLDLIQTKFETIPTNLHLGKATNSYVSLSFVPRSFVDSFSQPHPYIHRKDQDFVLGCSVQISIFPKDDKDKASDNIVVLPLVAIECKTYLERNMLDSCASTAARLKRATPYCIYFVVAEYLKMRDAQPELTDIDEVFVLCKASNAERLAKRKRRETPHPIHADLIIDLYKLVEAHLNRIWWSPEDALMRGRIINRS